jgi:ATP-dependent protease ClpP protease subunit
MDPEEAKAWGLIDDILTTRDPATGDTAKAA